MLNSTEQIIEQHLNDHIIREKDLAMLFSGSPARRYALINKALKKGELIQICRGFYTLNEKFQKKPFSQYYLANRLAANSFVTAESALSFHGWIPERIVQTISITAFGRSKIFKTPFGEFIYYKTPTPNQFYYYGVELTEIDKHPIYIASPLRALIDYVYLHKVENADTHFLKLSLRIEESHYSRININNIEELMVIYKSHYVKKFLKNLIAEIHNE